jgi:Uma2 family endonuclease
MLTAHLFTYHLDHGGEVLPAPTDVLFTDRDVVEPDVIFVREENRDRLEERFVRSAPDIVIEVSSPSTRHLEIVRKRELYERFAVPEYWYIDLEAERVEVYRLQGGGYGTPVFLVRDDVLESPILPSFSVSVDEILGESPA